MSSTAIKRPAFPYFDDPFLEDLRPNRRDIPVSDFNLTNVAVDPDTAGALKEPARFDGLTLLERRWRRYERIRQAILFLIVFWNVLWLGAAAWTLAVWMGWIG